MNTSSVDYSSTTYTIEASSPAFLLSCKSYWIWANNVILQLGISRDITIGCDGISTLNVVKYKQRQMVSPRHKHSNITSAIVGIKEKISFYFSRKSPNSHQKKNFWYNWHKIQVVERERCQQERRHQR